MPTITIDNKEIALSPLSFEDGQAIEREAAATEIALAEERVQRMDRLKIGTDADRLAILDKAQDAIEHGDAESQFIRGFKGQSFILWLSARKLLDGMSLEEFRRKVSFREAHKFNELIAGSAKESTAPQPLPSQEKYRQTEEQEERRTRIFNALCEGEKITPQQLREMDVHSVVPLFCKYAGIPGCNPETLAQRILEYCALTARKGDDDAASAGVVTSNPPNPNEPLIASQKPGEHLA